MKYSNIINIILIGDNKTGKTTVFNRILKNKYDFNYTQTNGINYLASYKIINNKKIKINIWDTGIINSKHINLYLKSINIVLLICNLNNKDTQTYILKELNNKLLENKKIYILCNIINDKNNKLCNELIKQIYNFNIKIIIINFKNEYCQLISFYNDIIIEALNSNNYIKYK